MKWIFHKLSSKFSYLFDMYYKNESSFRQAFFKKKKNLIHFISDQVPLLMA